MGRVFELQTVQVSAFKVLIEALREILTDTNIEFTPQGVKIIATDPSVTILVHLFLDKDKFENYECPKTILAGVNMLNLFKLTKTMSNNDALTLFIDEEDHSRLGIRIENEEKNSVTTYKMNLMDLDENSVTVPPIKYSSIITMPSSDFQKVCRDSYNISDIIEIKSIGQQLIFSCQGDFASQESVFGETSSGISVQQNETIDVNHIIQGYYQLRYLVLFSKCANLCQQIRIFLDNEYPIVIEFTVGSLGSLKLALAPQIEEE
jgi:proliferating cell nuclear antigen